MKVELVKGIKGKVITKKIYSDFFEVKKECGRNLEVILDIDDDRPYFLVEKNKRKLWPYIHEWLIDNKVSYSLDYIYDLKGNVLWTIDLPDEIAILFKLTWC